MFNSSDTYDVAEGYGLRCKIFQVTPERPVYLTLTHHPKADPTFIIVRVAGRNAQTNQEITTQEGVLDKTHKKAIISWPGTYYLHSPEAHWMRQDTTVIVDAHQSHEAQLAAHGVNKVIYP